MRAIMRLSTLVLAISFSLANLAQAAEGTRHNPFQRSSSVTPASKISTADRAAVNYPTSHPRLRGVLQATDGSLANLDGHVLAQGESALGYTLVAVQDHSAKFRFRHQIITLQVTEDRP